METAMAKTEGQAVERAPDILSVIAQAARDPNVNIDKLERLLAIQREIVADQRREKFHEALARAQALMPQLDQNGVIDYGKGAKIKYSKMEDIDEVIRPIYSVEGFSISWNSEPVMDGKLIKTTGYFSCAGHTEQRSMTLPPDSGGGKNIVQQTPSTNSYAKRQITKNFFNLVERGRDRDGAESNITEDEANTMLCKLQEINANIPKFLEVMQVSRIGDIRKSALSEAYRMIEKKRGSR